MSDTNGEMEAVIKVLGAVPTPNALPPDDEATRFTIDGLLEPPYRPQDLCAMHDRSSVLQPNVTAYAVNICAFGHRLEPAIDLAAAEADDLIRDALTLERIHERKPAVVTPEEVRLKRLTIEQTSRIERLQLEVFFEHCCVGMSFTEMCERTWRDVETTGNGYWEVLRDEQSQISQLAHVASSSMRLMRVDQDWTEFENYERISAISFGLVKRRHRFRRYVQVTNGMAAVYFKELGDPRVLSARSGRYYQSQADLNAYEPMARPATEIMHFPLYSPTSPYGVPRWIGCAPAIAGARASEEVNAGFFDRKCIPQYAILVSGGTLGDDAQLQIDKVLASLRGRQNFHAAVVIQAKPFSSSGLSPSDPAIELVPLQQITEGQFQEYEKNCAEKVGNAFRLPKILRGNSADINRATADAALEYAEMQVFAPERAKFEHAMNTRILSDMGVRFWRYKANGPAVKNRVELSTMITQFVTANILTPGEGRELAAEVFGRPFEKVKDDWALGPVARITDMGQLGFGGGGAPPGAADPFGGGFGTVQARLKALRERLTGRAEVEAELDAEAARAADARPAAA